MKNPLVFRLSILLICLCLTPLPQAQAQAQSQPNLPGYWNLETNLTTRAYTIVRFYNGQDQLVYEETLPKVCLDLSRRPGRGRRTITQLDIALQQVLKNPATGQNATLLAGQFSSSRRTPRAYATR